MVVTPMRRQLIGDCLGTFDVCSENRTLSGFVSFTGHRMSDLPDGSLEIKPL